MLYPYRASARKNQLRWQFGVLVPARQASRRSERSSMRTECIVDPGAAPTLDVRLRCLQVQQRTSRRAAAASSRSRCSTSTACRWVAWDEAVEHEIDVAELAAPAVDARREVPVDLPARRDVEELRAAAGDARRAGPSATGSPSRAVCTSRRRGPTGPARSSRSPSSSRTSPTGARPAPPRDDVMRRSLVAVHTLLAVDDGAFVSLLDPPAAAAEAAAGLPQRRHVPRARRSRRATVDAVVADHPLRPARDRARERR